jgi:hypothetical protein
MKKMLFLYFLLGFAFVYNAVMTLPLYVSLNDSIFVDPWGGVCGYVPTIFLLNFLRFSSIMNERVFFLFIIAGHVVGWIWGFFFVKIFMRPEGKGRIFVLYIAKSILVYIALFFIVVLLYFIYLGNVL